MCHGKTPALHCIALHCTHFATTRDFLAEYVHDRIDIALVELDTSDTSRTDLIRWLSEKSPTIKIVALITSEDDTNLVAAIEAGACGYFVKNDTAVNRIYLAIADIVRGEAPMSLTIARRVIACMQSKWKHKPQGNAVSILSGREHEILTIFSKGFTAKRVAQLIGLSYETVRTHQKNIYKKLNANSMIEAIEALRRD